MNHSYLTVEESGGDVFSDSLMISASGALVFASLWGRDTGIQQLLGLWTLGDTEGGSATLTLNDPETGRQRHRCRVRGAELSKTSARMKETLLGDLVHTFVFDQKCLSGDGTNRRFWLLNSPADGVDARFEHLVWDTVKRASPIPLLDTWKAQVLALVSEKNWLSQLRGFNMMAHLIDLSDVAAVERELSSAVKSGNLQIEGIEPPTQDVTQASGLFDDVPVIHSYTRAEAIEEGTLVDVSEVAREAGFKLPCALTKAVWESLVAWHPLDTRHPIIQDESARLWDILYTASMAARQSKESRLNFELCVVPCDGRSKEPVLTSLKAICGPGDTLDPVITIMLPDED